jgi:predicted SPOUT superfamily RNA methylase MTH1
MAKRKSALSIYVPISILSDVSSLIEKTFKVGQIARHASIFRVERIVVYKDSKSASHEDGYLIRDLLAYAETPQYLRKLIFPIMPNLKYAGLIPPLRTPHHPLGSDNPIFREGFVLKSGKGMSRVEIGLRAPVEVAEELTPHKRVTLRNLDGRWVPSSKSEAPHYWGYETRLELKPLLSLIRCGSCGFVIATSRLGKPLSSVAGDIQAALTWEKQISILFGSPGEGLNEILAREGAKPEDISDVVVNMIPEQGTATVRTEEAVAITLAVMRTIEISSSTIPQDR